MPVTKEVQIQGVNVIVSQPYEAGHPITEAEAKALNQTRTENIGNNMRAKFKDLLSAEGATPDSIASEAQALVDQYDSTYEFTLASAGGSTRLDPLSKEANRIASDYLMAMLKDAGQTRKAYEEANGEDAFKNKVAEIAGHDKVIAMAKKRLKERESLDSLEF